MSSSDVFEPSPGAIGAAFGLGYPALVGVLCVWKRTGEAPWLGAGCCIAGGLVVLLALRLVARLRGRARTLLDVLVLGFLPAWGLVYSHWLAQPGCEVSACDAGDAIFRPLAEPEVYGLVALHVLIVLAYAISRRRPEALRPLAEALVNAALLAGLYVHAVLAAHFARWLGAAALFPPVFLPCAAPLFTVVLYGIELHGRLRRRAREADTPKATVAPDSVYREGPPQEPLPPTPRLHLPTLARAVALAPVLLGVHAVLHALWLGRADGGIAVVTRTCGHVLSYMPVVETPCNGHYLCTIAARGHPWLVRPERIGRRHGVAIVVNRQLALANAFEDLLHERCPRLGRLARRVYDRLGLPVSRYLRRPLLADLVYLAMKPAEWVFYASLLLLDRGEPEARIDRMYR
jgi:hypothetical protein